MHSGEEEAEGEGACLTVLGLRARENRESERVCGWEGGRVSGSRKTQKRLVLDIMN